MSVAGNAAEGAATYNKTVYGVAAGSAINSTAQVDGADTIECTGGRYIKCR